jgi:uncharacterized protein
VPADLLTRLRAVAEARATSEPAHDFAHVLRVTENARRLAVAEGARLDVVLPATMLHELFNYPKGHPDSHRSGEVCAEHALAVLEAEGVTGELAQAIATCIREHPFSRGIVPRTLEGKIVQDADRLDAIGAIGVARCMATCAEMRRPFYSPVDPFCRAREPNDKEWGIDHFYRKLLRVPDGLHTRAAREAAEPRVAFMRAFLAELERETSAPAC